MSKGHGPSGFLDDKKRRKEIIQTKSSGNGCFLI